MNKGLIDDATIDIPCECGDVTPKSIGWLKSNDQFVCKCGRLIRINAGSLVKEVSNVDKSVEDLQKTIDRINKGK